MSDDPNSPGNEGPAIAIACMSGTLAFGLAACYMENKQYVPVVGVLTGAAVAVLYTWGKNGALTDAYHSVKGRLFSSKNPETAVSPLDREP